MGQTPPLAAGATTPLNGTSLIFEENDTCDATLVERLRLTKFAQLRNSDANDAGEARVLEQRSECTQVNIEPTLLRDHPSR
jgi:hypothetical protein